MFDSDSQGLDQQECTGVVADITRAVLASTTKKKSIPVTTVSSTTTLVFFGASKAIIEFLGSE
jgi:hypothetical protein